MFKSPSPTCRAAFFVFGVTACLASHPALAQGTDEQQAACAGDAFTLCRADIPDVAKITACMGAHKAQLSPKCRAVFDASTAPKAEAPKAAERKPAERDIMERKTVVSKTVMRKTVEHKTDASAAKPGAPKQTRAITTKTASTKTTSTKTTSIQTARSPKMADRKTVLHQTVGATAARRPRPEAPAVPREPAAPPAVAAVPVPALSPESSVPGLESYRAGVAKSCAQGLIDPYTCRTTLDLLKRTR